ncbi:MAG: hypothetical protein JNK44_16685 [Cyclobacteriaceae bacterium]|nr:hypothetical protein [Cyclobacteriaceae bacterium]
MRVVILIVFVIPGFCFAQSDYQSTLSRRLEEIKQLGFFDNSVVVYDDSSGYGTTFPRWNPNNDYYQDDMTFIGGTIYRALVDSKGKNPTTSRKEWTPSRRPLPYLFLRDTATTDDIKTLLRSDHPYIRVYAFAALAHRKYSGLFEIVLNNLNDTTRITQMTSDYGYDVSPADMMLKYSIHGFTTQQKDTLKRLILTKYNHLKSLEEVLFFHKPSPQEYPYVKSVVSKDPDNKFGLVALSKYCNAKDFETISKGFKLDVYNVYYRGYKIFFNAIENCPDNQFKSSLISQKTAESHENMWIDEYYVRALASYRDKDCLRILTELARQNSRYKQENIGVIYRALEKYYSPIYDSLINEIKKGTSEKELRESNPNRLEESPWNY